MSERNLLSGENGVHCVRHHDHPTGEWSEIADLPAGASVGDLVAWITERADDGDFIILPDGSPVVLVEEP